VFSSFCSNVTLCLQMKIHERCVIHYVREVLKIGKRLIPKVHRKENKLTYYGHILRYEEDTLDKKTQ